ncbi:MAG: hypothetical protein NT038_11210, partial [Euryarchaeota archaeon]|nr:hypothetical protein [Euryarchaeota archaeon]
MRRKIISILLVAAMCMTSIVIVPKNIEVKADPGGEGYNDIDTSLVYSVCQNLSNVIFDAYDDELRKGREFGSKGELYASDFIYDFFYDLGLNPVKEGIQSYPNNEIDDKLDVLARGLKVDGNPVECYISPRWNLSYLNPFYNKYLLTNNFSYSDLKILRRPSIYTTINQFIQDIIEELFYKTEEEFTLTDYDSVLSFITTKFEDAYDINFNELTQQEAESKFAWFDELMDEVSGEDFVLIDEDPFNNPNPTQDFITPDWFKNVFPNPLSVLRIIRTKLVLFIQMLILSTCPSFKGLILYDFNDDVHDMVFLENFPLPIIFMNGTEGQPLYNNPDDYTIDFY